MVQSRQINISDYYDRVIELISQLNPHMKKEFIDNSLKQMDKFDNYLRFGLFDENKLIGLSSGWVSYRLYSGKQLELDNVIIDTTIQSKGYGSKFLKEIEKWEISNNFNTVEFKTYVENDRSHKFYFNQAFKILGFHFQKYLINNNEVINPY